MCDTAVALGNATADGSVILAKNSDRHPNEAHELVSIPRRSHPAGSVVRCTYVEIPEVAETNAVLLARPFWIWGAEMGANERGVVIGNEALYTRAPMDTQPGLIGMDFIRLALERASSARGALEVITELLRVHGQGGNCSYWGEHRYHNSYLIAGLGEAWVLETADREWAARRVRDVQSISNAITIGDEWDLASPGLVDYAVERGWCRNRSEFHFGRCYTDWDRTKASAAVRRQCRSTDLLEGSKGQITVASMMSLLRDHGAESDGDKSLDETRSDESLDPTVCMHAGFGPVLRGQSTGSLVSHLRPGWQTHWLTGTSAPCTGVFKPVWLDAGLPDLGSRPTDRYSPDNLWWRHELLHRSVVRDYSARLPAYREERNALEASFLAEAGRVGLSSAERLELTRECFDRAEESRGRWVERVQATPARPGRSLASGSVWRQADEECDIAAQL